MPVFKLKCELYVPQGVSTKLINKKLQSIISVCLFVKPSVLWQHLIASEESFKITVGFISWSSRVSFISGLTSNGFRIRTVSGNLLPKTLGMHERKTQTAVIGLQKDDTSACAQEQLSVFPC